ncbi:MAG: prolipoprotein diacylglyceryl transferase [Acidimicrobiales bacterium]
MKPIPIVFHLGSLQVHTYGIGLAVTFWFAYRYFERRLRASGYPWEWLSGAFLWIIGAAIVGARVVHVVANAGFYSHNVGDIIAVWHGGLSSFGGLLFAVPVGIFFVRKNCPDLRTITALDLVTPVLLAAWSLGRLLGPQLEINGGGHPTSAWYGLSYAGQVGKRIPVPLFQSIECLIIFLIVLAIERKVRARGGPPGFVLAAGATIWDVSRFTDEFFWLATPRLWDAVEVTAVVFTIVGLVAMAIMWRRFSRVQLSPAGSVDSMESGGLLPGSVASSPADPASDPAPAARQTPEL